MRVFVSAETSGASRKAFETVITDTPARSAMSFKRTMMQKKGRSGRQSGDQGPETEAGVLHSMVLVPLAVIATGFPSGSDYDEDEAMDLAR